MTSRTRTRCPSTFAFSATSDLDRLTTLQGKPPAGNCRGFFLCRASESLVSRCSVLPAMPTGRADARPMTGSASSGTMHRRAGTHESSVDPGLAAHHAEAYRVEDARERAYGAAQHPGHAPGKRDVAIRCWRPGAGRPRSGAACGRRI